MKNIISLIRRSAMVSAVIALPSISVLGADPAPAAGETAPQPSVTPGATVSVIATAPAAEPVAAKLPYGTSEVVKLSRAQVSDDVVLSYVQNSGIAYSLSPDDIVRLRHEGVSDRVINAMLDQHKRAVEVAQRAGGPAPVYRDNAPEAGPGTVASETAPATAQPPVVEAPLTPSGSSVYVIPYQPTTYGVYPYYPYSYYGPYYYGGPVVSFRFGFGGHGHGHFHHRWR